MTPRADDGVRGSPSAGPATAGSWPESGSPGPRRRRTPTAGQALVDERSRSAADVPAWRSGCPSGPRHRARPFLSTRLRSSAALPCPIVDPDHADRITEAIVVPGSLGLADERHPLVDREVRPPAWSASCLADLLAVAVDLVDHLEEGVDQALTGWGGPVPHDHLLQNVGESAPRRSRLPLSCRPMSGRPDGRDVIERALAPIDRGDRVADAGRSAAIRPARHRARRRATSPATTRRRGCGSGPVSTLPELGW